MQPRTLAAILFADIVGYTAMMQHDENQGLQKVERFRTVLEEKVGLHNGKILQYYGDGCLVTFSSGILAVTCAKEIQEDLHMQGKEKSVPVRIGIHIGDVVVKNDAIFGDGVNLASRIESLSVAGGVLFSQRLVADLKSHPQFDYTSLGDFHFKNVDQPMEIFALSNKGFPIPKRSEIRGKLNSKRETEEGKASIAVLPFRDMSPGRDQEYFADGIAEEILNTLAQLKELKVVGRTSSFSFKGKKTSIGEIGAALNITHVLEGSVRKHGNKVRITVQLINVDDGFHIWSKKFDDDFTDIFKIQDKVAENIGKVLLEKLAPQQLSKLRSDTVQTEAYELFLRAKYIMSRFMATFRPDDFEKSEQLFQAAIEIDSNYALARAGLAELYDTYVFYQLPIHAQGFAEYNQLRIEESDLAHKIDPNSAYTNLIKARVMLNTFSDLEEVYRLLLKAYELNPNGPEVLLGLVDVYIRRGLFLDALKFADQAITLDPLHTWSHSWKIYALGLLGDFEQAIQVSMATLEISSNELVILANMATFHSFLNNREAALSIYEKIDQINPEYLKHNPYFQIKRTALEDPAKLPPKITAQPSIALLPVGNVEIDYISGDIDRFEKGVLSWWERWKTGTYASDLNFFSNKNCSSYLHLKHHPMFQKLRLKPWFQVIMDEEKKKYDHNIDQFIRPEVLFSK